MAGNPLSNAMAAISQMGNMVRSAGSPDALAQQLYQTNPEFRALADQVQGMTPEEAFASQGLDFNQFRGRIPF